MKYEKILTGSEIEELQQVVKNDAHLIEIDILTKKTIIDSKDASLTAFAISKGMVEK